jgi:hypothetical protein
MTAADSSLAPHARRLEPRQVGGRSFERILIRTHKIMIGEHLEGVVERYAGELLHRSSVICLSQKVVSICLYNVRHISSVRESGLARLIVRFVTKHPNMIGWEHPRKMQLAIEAAGYRRAVAAVVVGGLTRLLLRRRGDFWRVLGNHASEIDGFNPRGVRPFDEWAMLPHPQPGAICDELAKRFGCAVVILDANNIDVQVIAASRNLGAVGLDDVWVRELTLDNPMGQDDELTPMIILREAGPA